MITLTLILGLSLVGDRPQRITAEVQWPTVPDRDSQLTFQGQTYDVMNVSHDLDASQIRVHLLALSYSQNETDRADTSPSMP